MEHIGNKSVTTQQVKGIGHSPHDTEKAGGMEATHGLTVLSSARTGSRIDPHVYRDWLIFEERLKQNHRKLKKKKRRYLFQVIFLVLMIIYSAYRAFMEKTRLSLLFGILCIICIYSTHSTVNNRKFVQSVKFQAQCNRVLHQFRMRFDSRPAQTQLYEVQNQISSSSTNIGTNSSQFPLVSSDNPNSSSAKKLDQKNTKPLKDESYKFLKDAQMVFFPAVPRHLRDGYMQFKVSYHKKRELSKKRLMGKPNSRFFSSKILPITGRSRTKSVDTAYSSSGEGFASDVSKPNIALSSAFNNNDCSSVMESDAGVFQSSYYSNSESDTRVRSGYNNNRIANMTGF